MQNTPTNSSLGLKTCQLLLVNYNNIYNAISKPGADKVRFASLIKELEADILQLESSDLAFKEETKFHPPPQRKPTGLVTKYRNGSNTL